jgi:phospholipid transport system substrate-binding protein
MKKQTIKRFILTMIMLLSLGGASLAQTQRSPVDMIQSLANQLTNALARNKAILSSSRADAFINKQVEKIIVPNVNITYMAQSVVGRYYWNQATGAQRKAFIQQFKRLVIANYSAALASYNDDKVEVDPLRSNAWQAQGVVTVRSIIIRKNGQRISINYDMSNSTGRWLINDFTIENVAMTDNYRSQFANTLAQGGMGALLNSLTAHNKKIS